MKHLFFFLTALLFINCKTKNEETSTTNTISTKSNEVIEQVSKNRSINTIVPDPDAEEGIPNQMLLGKINRKGLEQALFKEWYTKNFNEHVLDIETIEQIKPLLKDINIQVFMGTWCTDSQREIPALYKILDQVGFNYNHFSITAVNHDKKTPEGLEEGFAIKFVPTIIITKHGKELNRIVEYAIQTLEKDILSILKAEPYKHAYAE